MIEEATALPPAEPEANTNQGALCDLTAREGHTGIALRAPPLAGGLPNGRLLQKSRALGAWRVRILTAARDIRRKHAEEMQRRGIQSPAPIPLETLAQIVGTSVTTLWRLENDFAQLEDEELTEARLAGKYFRGGRKSGWAYLLENPEVQRKLRENYAASLHASCELATNDRHTGDMVKACQHFAREPECPDVLARKLLQRKIPSCFKEFLRRITPEQEAYIRGPKALQLHGPSGQKAKLIGLLNGQAAYMPAGWKVQLDDMSVNQPYWCDGPEGQPMLSRQGLFARCVKGRWLAADLIARVRESYTSADILQFVQRLFELLGGMPRVLGIEQSVWGARNIAGYTIDENGDWHEDLVQRPEMPEEDRLNLTLGLRALGIEVEYCHSARGKADLEGGFNPLQGHLAQFTKDFVNIGRHRGEFERCAKKLRQQRAGSHHPADLGFAHQNQLLERLQSTFDFINSRLPLSNRRSLHDVLLGGRPVATLDELWQRDTELCPLLPLPEDADLAFLPIMRQRMVQGGALYPRVETIEYPFRAVELAELGDGYACFIRFDTGDLTRGAGVYNREPLGSPRNFRKLAVGALICRAAFDAPGFAAHAIDVPEALPRVNVQQIYGAGIAPDGGAGLRAQQNWVRKAVRSAFTGSLPGQPRTRIISARDGLGNVTRISQNLTTNPRGVVKGAGELDETRRSDSPVERQSLISSRNPDNTTRTDLARTGLGEINSGGLRAFGTRLPEPDSASVAARRARNRVDAAIAQDLMRT